MTARKSIITRQPRAAAVSGTVTTPARKKGLPTSSHRLQDEDVEVLRIMFKQVHEFITAYEERVTAMHWSVNLAEYAGTDVKTLLRFLRRGLNQLASLGPATSLITEVLNGDPDQTYTGVAEELRSLVKRAAAQQFRSIDECIACAENAYEAVKAQLVPARQLRAKLVEVLRAKEKLKQAKKERDELLRVLYEEFGRPSWPALSKLAQLDPRIEVLGVKVSPDICRNAVHGKRKTAARKKSRQGST